MRIRLFAIAVLTLSVAIGTARADESKIQLNDVPKGGLEAVKAMFPKAEITGAAKETEHDKTVYEVTLKQSGRDLTPETRSGSNVRIRAWSAFQHGGIQDGQEAFSSRADHWQVA